MTEESLNRLGYLRCKRMLIREELEIIETSLSLKTRICDHKYPDGTSALSPCSDGAWCSICEKKV